MKQPLYKKLVAGVAWFTTAALWACAASTFVSPAHCRFLGVVGLAFPFFLAGTLFALALTLLVSQRHAWIPLIGLAVAFPAIRTYCPDVKHVVIIFNPADITGLITLIYSGLKPSQLTTLAALDSTRLRSELAKYFHISPDEVCNSRTYGGHGEQMAVFASTTTVQGKPLTELIGTKISQEDWDALRQRVIQGGKHIIDLRGRSSFQSPAYVSIEMIAAAMGGPAFRWPAGVYVSTPEFDHIMMAMETSITRDGVSYKVVEGLPEEHAALKKSYEHLCALRDEVIEMGVLPPIAEWNKINPNLK